MVSPCAADEEAWCDDIFKLAGWGVLGSMVGRSAGSSLASVAPRAHLRRFYSGTPTAGRHGALPSHFTSP